MKKQGLTASDNGKTEVLHIRLCIDVDNWGYKGLLLCGFMDLPSFCRLVVQICRRIHLGLQSCKEMPSCSFTVINPGVFEKRTTYQVI